MVGEWLRALPVGSHLMNVQQAAMEHIRGRRIWLLMLALWIMNGFDLVFTIYSHQQGVLEESNPIALALLPHGAVAVASFKILLVTFGSAILLLHRHLVLVECLAWMMVVIYVGVSLRWMVCYEFYEVVVASHFRNPIDMSSLGMM